MLLVSNVHDRDWDVRKAKSTITKGDIHQEDVITLNAYAPSGGAWNDTDGLKRGNIKT